MAVYSVRNGDFGTAVIMDLARPVVTHIHLEYHVFVALQGGLAKFQVGNQSYPLSMDHCVAVNPWQPHSYDLVGGSPPPLAIVLYIDPIWMLDVFSDLGCPGFQTLSTVPMTPCIERLSQEMMASMLWSFDDAPEHPRFSGIVRDLCMAIAERAFWRRDRAIRSIPRFRTPVDYRLRKSMVFMRDHIDSRLSLDVVAKHAGLSRPRFFHLFREQSGVTPNMYWDTLRLNSAFKKLSARQASIQDISFDLGFSSQSNFTRFFVNHFNASPSQFRGAADQI